MTTYTNRTINATGLAEIHAFLASHHKKGGDHFTADMLRAWAADAEFQMSEGNDADIEIKSWDTVSGRTELFTVSPAGIDTEMVEIDED
jgi:hypothetical protein